MAPDKMSQLSIESSSWDMKARMTCIGQIDPKIALLQVMRAFVSYTDPLITFYVIYTLHFIEVSVIVNTTISYIEFLRDF